MEQYENNISIGVSIGLSKKFEQDDWLIAERKLGKFERDVIECLIKLSNNEKSDTDQNYIAIGDNLYIQNRDLLKDPLPLISKNLILNEEKEDTNKENKKGGKKGAKKNGQQLNKADTFRYDIATKKVKSTIETLLKAFNIKDFQPYIAFNSDIIEIKGIGLLYSGLFLIANKEKYMKKKHLPFAFGIIVAIQRFINNCYELDGKNIMNCNEKTKVSSILIDDLKRWLRILIRIYPYSGFAIYDYAPELLIYTEYDNAIPSTGIRPRKHQIELINTVSENFDNGFMIVYNPMIGAGKTTSIVALASKISSLRIKSPEKYGKMQVIFACNLASVKGQAANICYNGGIKFAIAGRDPRTGEGYRIVNHNLCKNNEERIVIITSPEIASEILSDSTQENIFNNFLLYLDEPTIGADNPGSESLVNNMSLIAVMPKRVILSSATFPETDLINDITKNFTRNYPSAEIITVYSAEIQIGCDVKTYNNELVVPHLGIKTKNELEYVINVIKKCPFLGRTYTPHVVKTLYNIMNKLLIPNIPNISLLFSNVDNMSSDKVRQTAMDMLNILYQQEDNIITQVCESKIMTDKENILIDDDEYKKNQDDEFEWDEVNNEEIDDLTDPVNFKKLGTTQAWRMQNTTLIATTTPVEFVREMFSNLITDIYNSSNVDMDINNVIDTNIFQYKNSNNIISKYKRDIENYEKKKVTLERNTENEDKLSQLMQEYEVNNKPKIKFPLFGHINTLEHTRKYAKKHASKLIGRFIRSPLILENIPFDKMSVPDDLLTLLFAGIGVYVANHRDIDSVYLKTVLKLASEGSLAYIVADSSICYGTNYPINRVIITDEFANNHNINTLFQLMGRAGRVGKSWVAESYVSDQIARRIIMYTRNMSESKIEADNMVNEYNKILKFKEEKQQIKLDELLTKYITRPEEKKQNECIVIISPPVSIELPKEKELNIHKQHIVIESLKEKVKNTNIEEIQSVSIIEDNTNWRRKDTTQIQKIQIEEKKTDDFEISWRRNDKTQQHIVEEKKSDDKYVPPHMKNKSSVKNQHNLNDTKISKNLNDVKTSNKLNDTTWRRK